MLVEVGAVEVLTVNSKGRARGAEAERRKSTVQYMYSGERLLMETGRAGGAA